MKLTQLTIACLVMYFVVSSGGRGALAQAPGSAVEVPPVVPALYEELRRGFSSRFSLLGFGIVQQPIDSALNPDNALDIPRYQAEVDVRPNLNLVFRRLELDVKPRLEVRQQWWEDGARDGENDTDVDLFVNTWLVRFRLTNQLFVSYGRENLLWGPAYLFSPSNPFSRDNGRNNPKVEVPGVDYGRIVWIPSAAWTVSFIANTDEGRLELPRRDFTRTYAVKLDYTGPAYYASLIPSVREDGEPRLGFLAGWTVSDALLLYTEGAVADAIDTFELLVGAAYTLVAGPTIAVEYYHNEEGCLLDSFVQCFDPTLADIDPADLLFRQNYLLVQYIHSQIWDMVNIVVRWIHNIDDHSNRIITIFEADLSDHLRFFTIGTVNVGDRDAELSSAFTYSLMVGLEYIF